MNRHESANTQKSEITLSSLKEIEESYRLAIEEANKAIAEGGATEPVREDLQTRYFLAKQEREDFESKHHQ